MDFDILIPILLGLGFFAMVFGLRYLHNKETMALIQNGLEPRQAQPKSYKYMTLKAGLLLIGAGIGLLLAHIIDQVYSMRGAEALYISLISIFGGAGLIASFFIEKKHLK